jgi:hypothetical protein
VETFFPKFTGESQGPQIQSVNNDFTDMIAVAREGVVHAAVDAIRPPEVRFGIEQSSPPTRRYPK